MGMKIRALQIIKIFVFLSHRFWNTVYAPSEPHAARNLIFCVAILLMEKFISDVIDEYTVDSREKRIGHARINLNIL